MSLWPFLLLDSSANCILLQAYHSSLHLSSSLGYTNSVCMYVCVSLWIENRRVLAVWGTVVTVHESVHVCCFYIYLYP